MKKLIKLTCAGAVLLAFGCNKDLPDPLTPTPKEPEVPTETFNSLNDFLTTNEVEPETFLVTAQTGGSFTTDAGSKINVPANAFTDPAGNLVTGAVTLSMNDIFTTKEMIFSRVFPISYGQLLNSGGEFQLVATQNGTPLNVAPGQRVEVIIPAQAPPQNMELFFGNGDPMADSLNWDPADTTSASGFTFNSADDTYELQLDELGWANIDAFVPNPTYFDVTFDLVGVTGLDASNTTAYAVFDNQNAVWPLGSSYGSISNNTIMDNHVASVDMHVLVISVVGGQLYSGVLPINPTANATYTINMTATTSADLDNVITNLP